LALESVESFNKELSVQIQDRSFYLPNNLVPQHVRGLAEYDNGSIIQCDGHSWNTEFIPSGWAASQWNARLRGRFQLLLAALAERFDDRIYGMNLPETAIGVNETQFNFSSAEYVDGTLENAEFARSVFSKTWSNISTFGQTTRPTTMGTCPRPLTPRTASDQCRWT
jgi:Tfp pilus assembly protein PilW